MKYHIILKEGWMGDTLWACNVIKNITDMGYDFVFSHKWPFMNEVINLFEITHYPLDTELSDDYVKILYTHRIDHYENPLTDYVHAFNIEGVDPIQASRFYSLDKKLKDTHPVAYDGKPYITYDSDWQSRTELNTEFIIEELKKHIDVIPISEIFCY
jgi:hypothetical protein